MHEQRGADSGTNVKGMKEQERRSEWRTGITRTRSGIYVCTQSILFWKNEDIDLSGVSIQALPAP